MFNSPFFLFIFYFFSRGLLHFSEGLMLILGARGNAIFLFLSFSTDHPVLGWG